MTKYDKELDTRTPEYEEATRQLRKGDEAQPAADRSHDADDSPDRDRDEAAE